MTITPVSVDSAGNLVDRNSYTPSISADGRFVAFDSLASNIVRRSEERRVGKECRSRWSPYH